MGMVSESLVQITMTTDALPPFSFQNQKLSFSIFPNRSFEDCKKNRLKSNMAVPFVVALCIGGKIKKNVKVYNESKRKLLQNSGHMTNDYILKQLDVIRSKNGSTATSKNNLFHGINEAPF